MRKNKLITLLSCITFATVGVIAIANRFCKANVFIGKADNTTKRVYLDLSSCSWNSDGAWFAAYQFNNDSDNHWTKLEQTENSNIYYADLSTNYSKIIFTRNNGSKSELSWDSRWNQTVNLTLSDGNKFKIISGKDNSYDGSWNTINKIGRYAVGTFDGENCWSTDGGTFLNHDGEYTGVLSLKYGDIFKIAYYDGNDSNNLSDYRGFDKLTPNAAAYYCFSDDGTNDHNIKCYASGTYNLYFTDDHYDLTYKISAAINGDKNAEQFAARLMHYDNTANTCQDRFYDMRSYFLGLSADEQTTFKAFTSSSESQFSNAYARYTAWARALGEDPWTNAKAPNAIYGLRLYSNSNISNSTWIIALVALAGVSSIGCFIFYKKRKEN